MSFKQVQLLCAILFLCVTFAVSDYCQDNGCSDASKHVLCLYPPENNASACEESVYFEGVSPKLSKSLIEIQNTLRRELDGPSSPPLTWDSELAKMAQAWANQCPTHKDECHLLTQHPYLPVFQNVFRKELGHGKKINWSDFLNTWFTKEIQGLRPVGEYHGNNFAVNRVGCGVVMTVRHSVRAGHYNLIPSAITTVYLVCNYSTSEL